MDERTHQDRKPAAAGQVRSLTRGLTLLRHLAESTDGLTLTELAEISGLPPSTTHRLLTTLEAERFVRADPSAGAWRVGVAAFTVGAAFTRSRDLLTLTRPYLHRLCETTGETANLFVESQGEAICVAQVESSHTMRAITGVGGRQSLTLSAAGKILLAFSEAERRPDGKFHSAPRGQGGLEVIEPGDLPDSLARIRAIGYAVDEGEHSAGLRCVAAPVFDENGSVAAAMSVSGPATRMLPERLASLGRTVAAAASGATRDYGGTVPAESAGRV